MLSSYDEPDRAEVTCEGCGGAMSKTRRSEISLGETGSELPGADLVTEQLCSKQVLCWSCMNDSITQLLSH